MSPDQKNTPGKPEPESAPAGTGNASNPSPRNPMAPAGNHQLLDEKGEKYLRESANIEDLPDAEDQRDMEETFQEQEK